MRLNRFTFTTALFAAALMRPDDGTGTAGLSGSGADPNAATAANQLGAGAGAGAPAPAADTVKSTDTAKSTASKDAGSKKDTAKKPSPRSHASQGAPIPDAVARGDGLDEEKTRKPGKEVPDLAALGKAFVGHLPDEARSGVYKPAQDHPWSIRPIALADGWHRDHGTKWSFLIKDGLLLEAKSDDSMANQPGGTHGRTQRL